MNLNIKRIKIQTRNVRSDKSHQKFQTANKGRVHKLWKVRSRLLRSIFYAIEVKDHVAACFANVRWDSSFCTATNVTVVVFRSISRLYGGFSGYCKFLLIMLSRPSCCRAALSRSRQQSLGVAPSPLQRLIKFSSGNLCLTSFRRPLWSTFFAQDTFLPLCSGFLVFFGSLKLFVGFETRHHASVHRHGACRAALAHLLRQVEILVFSFRCLFFRRAISVFSERSFPADARETKRERTDEDEENIQNRS